MIEWVEFMFREIFPGGFEDSYLLERDSIIMFNNVNVKTKKYSSGWCEYIVNFKTGKYGCVLWL